MATKIVVLNNESLPSPQTGHDLTIWATAVLPNGTVMRTWAGWAETHLLALSTIDVDRSSGFTGDSQVWPSSPLAVGPGRVWRHRSHYLAYLASDALNIPEIARALSIAGVELLMTYTPNPLSTKPHEDPLWRAVQSNNIFGVRLSTQRPQFYVPCELDPTEEGVLSVEETDGGFVIEVAFSELHDSARLYPIRSQLQTRAFRSHFWWQS